MDTIECFVYPRLLLRDVVIGYDFGFFVQDCYIVIGNSKRREWAEECLFQWADENKRDITIVHEQEPSRSKNLKERP